MLDFKAWLRGLGRLLIVAVASFCKTMLLMLGLAAILASIAFYVLSGQQRWYGILGAVIAVVECVVVGAIWAGKRAVIISLVHGLRRYRLGAAAVRLLFERIMGITGEPMGARGNALAGAVERLPLAQAEKRLTDAVQGVLHAPETGRGPVTWLRRRLQGKLLAYVQTYTLARFRESGAQYGGVDLAMVKSDLEQRVDGFLIAKLTSGLNLWTLMVLVGLPSQVIATVYLALALLHMHG